MAASLDLPKHTAASSGEASSRYESRLLVHDVAVVNSEFSKKTNRLNHFVTWWALLESPKSNLVEV